MIRETLADKLAKNLRARRGELKQGEFAKKLGVSRATLNRLENGGQNTTLKTLDQIVRSQRCDIGDLFKDYKKADR